MESSDYLCQAYIQGQEVRWRYQPGNLNFEDKRRILREVVDNIIVNGDGVTIYGIIPVPEEMEDMSVELPSS